MKCDGCDKPISANFKDPMVYRAGDGWYCQKCSDVLDRDLLGKEPWIIERKFMTKDELTNSGGSR